MEKLKPKIVEQYRIRDVPWVGDDLWWEGLVLPTLDFSFLSFLERNRGASLQLNSVCMLHRAKHVQTQNCMHHFIFIIILWWIAFVKVKVKVNVDLYMAPRRENLTSKALGCGSHCFTCKHTTPAFTAYSAPEGATTEWTVIAPADEAYYSLIDPVRMKGWVGLVGWPTADGLPISSRSGADQWKFAGQRPTFYHWATQPTFT